MPVTRRYPIAELMEACRATARPTRRRVFIEYLLLAGVNDGDRAGAQLVALLHGAARGFHVNLIAYNPTATEYALAARAPPCGASAASWSGAAARHATASRAAAASTRPAASWR